MTLGEILSAREKIATEMKVNWLILANNSQRLWSSGDFGGGHRAMGSQGGEGRGEGCQGAGAADEGHGRRGGGRQGGQSQGQGLL